MVGMIIGVSLLITLCVGMVVAVKHQLKKTDPTNTDNSLKGDISTAQEFLPFSDIKDSMIDLGGHQYRAIIECSSINYNLKTDKEKEIIELSFQRFLNSLNSPITFFIQTRTIDNSKMIADLKEELEATLVDFPNLEEYANVYLAEISDLQNRIGNNKQKKKYIIVPYSEAIELTNSSDSEKYEYSINELRNRCSMIIDGLGSMGIKGKAINTREIAELLMSTYHKDNYSQVDQVLSGEYLSMIVEGTGNKLSSITPDARLDWILYEAQVRLQTELSGDNVPQDVQGSTTKAIDEISRIREAVAGFYSNKSAGEIHPLGKL